MFGRPKRKSLPVPPKTDYQATVDYLVGLSDEEFDKVGRVAHEFRKAERRANKILGQQTTPRTSIVSFQEVVDSAMQFEDDDLGPLLPTNGPKKKKTTKKK